MAAGLISQNISLAWKGADTCVIPLFHIIWPWEIHSHSYCVDLKHRKWFKWSYIENRDIFIVLLVAHWRAWNCFKQIATNCNVNYFNINQPNINSNVNRTLGHSFHVVAIHWQNKHTSLRLSREILPNLKFNVATLVAPDRIHYIFFWHNLAMGSSWSVIFYSLKANGTFEIAVVEIDKIHPFPCVGASGDLKFSLRGAPV